MQQGTFIPYMKKIIVVAYLLTCFSYADALSSSTITLIDSQYNSTSWGAANLLDGDPATRWLSRQQSNDLNFQLTDNGEAMCLAGFDLTNYGGDDRGVKQFVLLTTKNDNLSASDGVLGWQPLVAEENPVGYVDYLSWAQGARQVSVDTQYNATTWSAKNINDGSRASRWLSRKSNNVLQYDFDTDWDGSTGNGITINELEVTNYGIDDRSVKQLQVEVTNDGATWRKLQVPGTGAGDAEYIYSRYQDGGIIGAVDSQYNSMTYGANNIQDGDQNTFWLSRKGNNTIEYTFDPNHNGVSGADGDNTDLFALDRINIENYGVDDRSVNEFQLAVKTLANPDWHKINVPGAIVGKANYNFALSHHGGALVSIDSEYNSTSYGAKNIHDGDRNTFWLSRKANNELAFQFDADENGTLGATEDLFTLNSMYLRNYGNDDRAIQEFQIAVKTSANANWEKLNVPGASVGQANYNFAMSHQGGRLVAIDSEYNSTSYGAKNIHDGDSNTLWLSRKNNNELAFQFDADENGTLGAIDDLFTLKSVYLVNYGHDDRAIKAFQIAIKTISNPNWTKINVPGAAIGQADYNFALSHQGGRLVSINNEYNSTSWGAKNIHDGDLNSRWLSRQGNNSLDFQFDVNEDGVSGGAEDSFTLESFYLVNYGNDDRSIKHFQIEVKTLANSNWSKLPVSGADANTGNYNFALTAHGGNLTAIDSEYNSTSWAANNIHDGDAATRWLSRKQTNTLAFSFDRDFDGVMGDAINLDTIALINYGNDDRSIQNFEVDVQFLGSATWQTLDAPAGGTIFTATMDSSEQSWAIAPQTNVSAVRLRTLSNYGDATYTGAAEFMLSGTLTGQLYTYSAAMHGDGETFTLAATDQAVDVTDVRLKTINNHGDPSYIGARELKLQGTSRSESNTFIAAMHDNGETFNLDAEDIPVDVTDVKLITISNYGDPSYIGAKEFKLQGASVTETKTFIAAMHGNGESFALDANDIPVDVTDVKLITISNYGDPSYIGAKEFKLQGPSVTETKTFTAKMQGTLESFQLDANDIPVDVTNVKLITISNHGDPYYVGLREFEVVGTSVTAASTFTLPMNSEPFNIALDNEDIVSGVIGARIVTIKNYGDHAFTGLAEVKLLGAAITPSYIFSAENISSAQRFNFAPTVANIFRFHSLNNHGDGAYTGAADFALNSSFCATPIVQYSMDEASWRGDIEEVIDGTGHFNAQAFNGAMTSNGAPALTGNPGTCRYGSFDGVDDYIPLPSSFENLQDSFTITAWINPTNLSGGSRIFVDDENNQQGFGFSLSDEINGNGHLRFYSRGVNPVSVDTAGGVIAKETWSFVTAVHNSVNKTRQIYINGVAQTITGGSTSSTYTGTWGIDTGVASIGGETAASGENGSDFHFTGAIDELQVFDGAMTSLEVNQIYAQRHDCAEPVIHHYEITHDGNGLTCAEEPITIKACTNSDCSALSAEAVSLNFNITSPATGQVIKASPTFTGSTSINFGHSTAETITLSIDDASIAASNAVECSGVGSSCDMTFADAGFRFLYGDNNSEIIGHQTAGKGFSEALKLQAVKNNNGVCEGIFTGAVNISLAQQNVTPALAFNAGLAFQASGVNIEKHPLFSDNISLDFGDDSIAVLPNSSYLDAGEIRLHARYANTDITIVGSSNDFWVKPDRFEILAKNSTGNLNGSSAVSTTRHKAGENFDFTVRALNFSGNLTPNYRQADGQLALKVSRVAPRQNGAIDGRFTYAAGQSRTTATNAIFQPAILSNFSDDEKGSSAFNNAQYDEVGVINIDVQDMNYGGLGSVDGLVSANDFTIGRFTPAYFKQTVKEEHKGKLDAYQSAAGACAIADWAYTGQRTSDDKGAIGYSLEPKITISAFNASGGMTKNYTLGAAENFMKLSSASVNITLPTHDDNQRIVDSVADEPVAIAAVMELGSLSASTDESGSLIAGEWLYTFSSNDHFSYKRDDTSFLAPFGGQIPFVTEQITDSDGITLQMDPNTNKVVAAAVEKLVTDGVEIRFGRMVLENSYGAENSTLRAPLSVQVYDGTGFYRHTDESCLTALIGDKQAGAKYSGNMSLWQYRLIDIASDAIQVDDTDANISGVFDRGIQQHLFFSPPAKQGTLEWEYEVPSWLKFKWDAVDGDNDGNIYDDNPSAMLNFGVYRGNDRIISWREVVN